MKNKFKRLIKKNLNYNNNFFSKNSESENSNNDVKIEVSDTKELIDEEKKQEDFTEIKDDSKKIKKKKVINMLNEEQLNKAENIVNDLNVKSTKKIKTDKSLIERTESSKIILTEDNRQLLND